MVLTMQTADPKKKNPDLSAGAKIINHLDFAAWNAP